MAGELITEQKVLCIALSAAHLTASLLSGDRLDELVLVLDDLLQISVVIRNDLVQLLHRIDGVLLGVTEILGTVTADQPIAMPVHLVVLLRCSR